MKALLVRVGADQSKDGGRWNGPVDSKTDKFVYVPIPEDEECPIRPGLECPYSRVQTALFEMGWLLPQQLSGKYMHLDPDFSCLSYGDRGERAKQIKVKLGEGDLLVFYAGLQDVHSNSRLVYALIGLYVIDTIVLATSVPKKDWDRNAHTRRDLAPGADDTVIFAKPGLSGRLERCLPIGEYRDRAYRVKPDILEAWGDLTVKKGYLQRSARLPEFSAPAKFYRWFQAQGIPLCQRTN